MIRPNWSWQTWKHCTLRLVGVLWLVAAGCSPVGCGGGGGKSTSASTEPTDGSQNPSPELNGFDATRAFSLLKQQVEIGPRPPGSAAHDQMRDWLLARANEVADRVERQDFTQVVDGQSFALTNVLAVIDAAQDPAPQRILIGAHYDTRPQADQDPHPAHRDQPILGANDGASGVAVLLEIGRLLRAKRPQVEVVLAFFDGEDFGNFIYGSTYFASHMGSLRPDSAIIVDMVGDQDLHIQQELNSQLAAPVLWKRLMTAAADLGFSGSFDGRQMQVIDDHTPLIQQGVPAVDLIDFSYGPNNAYWHTMEDTVEQCSMESLRRVGEVVLRVIYQLP